MKTKQCRGCGQEKPLEDFHRDARQRDGRSSRCGECRSRASREWYHRDPEARQQREREYYEANRERQIEKQLRYDRRRRVVNPEATRAKQAAYMREWRSKNLEVRKDYELRGNVGISIEGYWVLAEKRGHQCWICGFEPEQGKYLCVDHDHACCPGKKSCGKCIRGLLCTACNLAIGYLRDDPERLWAALAYLEEKE